MNYWECIDWKKQDIDTFFRKEGLYLRFESTVNRDVRYSLLMFARWIRKEFHFPIRVIVYVKSVERIVALNGDLMCGTCWTPYEKKFSPCIKIATGDYDDMIQKYGKNEALNSIQHTMAEMLSLYFFWLNNKSFVTEEDELSEAVKNASEILFKYRKETGVTFSI